MGHHNYHLPLRLIPSETIPPAPNTSPVTKSAIVDWLPDFAGYSWVAYGASSLLVITHFPSPLSPSQLHVGTIFRQVIPLSSQSAAVVSAVSWSPAIPSSADIAAVVDRRVFLFRYDSSPGSFCWSQTALLVQAAKVEAITWTKSGDGIISAGTEVLLWKRNIKSWEIAWKFKMNVPQTLVSATWSLEGPSATCSYPTQLHDSGLASMTCSVSNCVNVYHYDGKSGYISTELRHPQPVISIHWRPSGGCQMNRAALYAPRHILLSSCLDGTVRLWSEVDGSRIRKGIKDSRDESKRSFCVVAVIEINRSLNGTLGTDICMTWALDLEGLVCVGDGNLFSTERRQNDEVGRCEWLIGFGPGRLRTFWAVHCLDDIATMRSPRVTLWKRQELLECSSKQSFKSNLFTKAVIWRKLRFGPPALCSFVDFSACNTLAWSTIYNQSLAEKKEKPSPVCETGNELSRQCRGILDTHGHTGNMLQIAVHPFMCEVQLAASVDSDGGLIFWSTSVSSYNIAGLPSYSPAWKLIGKMILQDNLSQEMSLNWAPLRLGEDLILLVGHNQGIDVYIVKISEIKEYETICHKLCTIPFVGHDHLNGPDKITSFPFDSTYKESSNLDSFLLLGVWVNSFRAESWKVALRCYESPGISGQSDCEANADAEHSMWNYQTDLAGKRYCLAVNLCSSYFPNGCDGVTSMSVVSPSSSTSSLQQMSTVDNEFCPNKCSFHIITGHVDGSSRFWRINISDGLEAHIAFELVGMLSPFEGPVSIVSAADQGQKIATICSTDSGNTLCIWEPHHLASGGTFELEDKIGLDGEVRALHWLVIENMLFLGVCFENELCIYSRKVYSVLTSSEKQIWVCIANVRNSPTISDFLLGPNGMIVLIHVNHFSLFHPWSFMDKDSSASWTRKLSLCEEISSEKISEGDMFFLPLTKTSFCPVESETQPPVASPKSNHLLKMTEVAEKLCGPLPFYHPEALLMNIYSGNWKRANVVVCHLIECLASNSTSEQRLNPTKSSINISQVNLSNYLEGQTSNGRTSQAFQWSTDLNTATWSSLNSESGSMQFEASNTVGNMFTASEFNQVLEKLQVQEALTASQKMQMLAIVDLLREINNSQHASAFESLDVPGRRFWCAIRLQQLEFHIRNSRTSSVDELAVDSQLISWAFHSDCHMNLFDTILPPEPTWEEMRKIGVGFWLTNLTDLRTKMEKLARRQYLKKKDPKACALLYIALSRLQVLTGLFKISKDEKDKPLVGFLSRNFQEEKHKAAASKNAYVLMGRHQFELAVAFFLLGGDIISAITVCAKNLGDGQLALVICRLVEGQNGPSERHLISKVLLPSAIEKGDYWLASILEWMLGNYLQSFLAVIGLQEYSNGNEPEKPEHPAFLDPRIGQCCLLLATKNSFRNALGEQNTALLCQWATVMTASAFNRCGFPLEALECLSASACIVAVPDNGTLNEKSNILPRIFRPSLADSSSWLSKEVSSRLVYQIKFDLAMQYVAKLMREHPAWHDTILASTEARPCSLEQEISQTSGLIERFRQKLDSAFACLEQKFNLARSFLLANITQPHIRYHLLQGSTSQVHFNTLTYGTSISSQFFNHLAKDAENLSNLMSRFVTAGSIASLYLLDSSANSSADENPYTCFQHTEFYMKGLLSSMCNLRADLMMFWNGYSKNFIGLFLMTLDLWKCCLYFTSALVQRDGKALAAMFQPILVLCTNATHRETDIENLKAILGQVLEALSAKASDASALNDKLITQGVLHRHGGDEQMIIPDDERCMILGASLWNYLSEFIKCQLYQLRNCLACNPIADMAEGSTLNADLDDSGFPEHVREIMLIFMDTIESTVTHVSFHTKMQLAAFFWHKIGSGNSIPTLVCLKEYSQSNSGSSELLTENILFSSSESLANICDDPKKVSELIAQLPIKLSELLHQNPGQGWNHFHMGAVEEHERLESYKQEGVFISSPRVGGVKGHSTVSEHDHNLVDSEIKGVAHTKSVTPFHSPREIYRRNGELMEALCINSIEQRQAAVASNKKGIVFFDWGDALPLGASSDLVWEEADWPQKGWAGTESTPIPTCVSPGVGLGVNKGSHLGLGGATVGNGLQVRPGGGVFRIPDYAGISTSSMGWGIQDDFDKFVDPPATLDNINARALASHPSRPYFLAGSSNTHIYLWEFGEEKAAATYGVLPAANVPPPYALASISTLQFDCSGHRFANCASDGTVCTWQLEVGGRSNVKPTDSSTCFNGYASDICYVATSGSIIASAGYSSNGVNVVIWDTLAPPTSSRAFVMCHEGGACSISVFDNDVGTGSISPLIVTGGKGGDVGLHDFRYIATGKTKRHKHSNTLEKATDTASIDVHHSSSVGDQNRHGMLWYIPKAHSGSITKISTVPNTSLFLTGSKDGDVKLWDAKKARLVYHWPKLHERHTFLQRTSQSFGGVTRVGVTDIQPSSDGFLTCGGDGSVKLIELKNLSF